MGGAAVVQEGDESIQSCSSTSCKKQAADT